MGPNAETLSPAIDSPGINSEVVRAEPRTAEPRTANVRLVTSSSRAEARSRAEAIARAEARERVEALTIRESHGETRVSTFDDQLIKGGLVSSTRYILECVFRDRAATDVRERFPWRPRSQRA